MLSITKTLRSLFARPATPPRPRRTRRPLRLECLEDRTLMCNPGELDPTFGGGDGISSKADFPGEADLARAVAVQPDGKILAGGRADVSAETISFTDFALARFNVDGSLDGSFGSGGMVTYNFSNSAFGSDDVIHAIAVQSDGKIVVAGQGGSDFGVLRYNTNGTLDKTFGKGGRVTTDFGGASDRASAVAIQPDGKIIVAGRGATNCVNCSGKIALARYTTAGKLDTSFDGDGKVITNLGTDADNEGVLGVAIQSNGKILAGGFSAGAGGLLAGDWTLLRYNSNGSLDAMFGSGGVVVTAGLGPLTSLALQLDGQIVAGGSALDINEEQVFAATRYNSNGTLDSSFDVDGIFVAPQIGVPCDPVCQGDGSRVRGVAVQSDGKIVLGGDALDNNRASTQFALVRLNSNGSFDNTFDSDGIALAAVGGAGGMALQADGKIVMSGTSHGILAARFCV